MINVLLNLIQKRSNSVETIYINAIKKHSITGYTVYLSSISTLIYYYILTIIIQNSYTDHQNIIIIHDHFHHHHHQPLNHHHHHKLKWTTKFISSTNGCRWWISIWGTFRFGCYPSGQNISSRTWCWLTKIKSFRCCTWSISFTKSNRSTCCLSRINLFITCCRRWFVLSCSYVVVHDDDDDDDDIQAV